MTSAPTTRDDIRARIVATAARLLQDAGAAGVTTRGVAERAGVQAPTIYRLFGDKDGLLEAVAEHVMATFVAEKAARVEAVTAVDADPLEDLRASWHAQIEFGLANPALFRFLSDPDRARRSPAVAAGLEVLRARVHRVALTGRLRVGEPQAVDLIRAGGVGTVTALLAVAPEDRDPALAGDMYDAVLRHILTDAPRREGGDAVATAVAFRALAPQLGALSEAERALLGDWLDRVVSAGR